MKIAPLGKNTEKIFRAIMAMVPENDDLKIDNKPGVYMALVVEKIGGIRFSVDPLLYFPLYSFAHYGEQNGDLMRDPDIVLADGGKFGLTPISYRNDYLGVDQSFVEYDDHGTVCAVHTLQQADCASFCRIWALNIVEQQGLKLGAAGAVLAVVK